MKETAAKRRDRAGGRDRDSKADKPKEAAGAEPQDVDMPEAEATSSVKPPKELDSLTLEDIKEHVKQIEKAVSGKEPRFVLRALRALPSTSRRLNTLVLHKTIGGFFTNNAATRDFLLAFLDEDTCVSRMAEGVRMFQGLLGVLSTRLGGLDGLRADLRDLLTQIAKVQEAARPGGAETDRDRDRERDRWAGMAAGLHGDYEAQAAAQLTLTQLRSFAHDVIRSLRAIAAHRTLAR